jgi:hypothetical protein
VYILKNDTHSTKEVKLSGRQKSKRERNTHTEHTEKGSESKGTTAMADNINWFTLLANINRSRCQNTKPTRRRVGRRNSTNRLCDAPLICHNREEKRREEERREDRRRVSDSAIL